MTTTTEISSPASAAETLPAATANAVATEMIFAAPAERVWDRLMFYEEIKVRPPWYLRLLLPVPLGTEGKKSGVGDEARCLYQGGHLLKRVTEIEVGKRYAFIVAEQALSVGGGLRLAGGEYRLTPLANGATLVSLSTRYVSPRWPRWLWRPIEAMVCHTFHRFILNQMGQQLAT